MTPILPILQTLDEIITKTPEDQQIETLLEFGTQEFGMQVGILSHIQGNVYTVEHFYPENAGLFKGQTFDVNATYCSITLGLRRPTAIHHMQNSEYHQHPCYDIFRLESYIGVPMYVHGQLYGTLNFSSLEPGVLPFTAIDRSLMEVLAYRAALILE